MGVSKEQLLLKGSPFFFFFFHHTLLFQCHKYILLYSYWIALLYFSSGYSSFSHVTHSVWWVLIVKRRRLNNRRPRRKRTLNITHRNCPSVAHRVKRPVVMHRIFPTVKFFAHENPRIITVSAEGQIAFTDNRETRKIRCSAKSSTTRQPFWGRSCTSASNWRNRCHRGGGGVSERGIRDQRGRGSVARVMGFRRRMCGVSSSRVTSPLLQLNLIQLVNQFLTTFG